MNAICCQADQVCCNCPTGGCGNAGTECDPHITTLDGTHYDFHAAGEFVALRGDDFEIQTRQTAIATTSTPGANPHTGLDTCVSLNSAVAARVGAHRVTYQPKIMEDGLQDPSGLELRVDGKLTELAADGLDLGSRGRIVKSAVGGGIEVEFPNGTIMIVTQGWGWGSQWYLSVNVYGTPATQGIMGVIAPGSWLPALPDGSSLGEMPTGQNALEDRYVALNDTFANAWRVTDSTSLFDYAAGTSTADFTILSWPLKTGPCIIPQPEPGAPLAVAEAQSGIAPQTESSTPLGLVAAQSACAGITDGNRKANCLFDLTATGEPSFAATYLLTQQLETGATTTAVTDATNPTRYEEPAQFTATVVRTASRSGDTPTGTVQFMVDGDNVGSPITLDANGRAEWSTSTLEIGDHVVAVSYRPQGGGVFLASSSAEIAHTIRDTEERGIVENRILWLSILLVIFVGFLVWWLRRPSHAP